MSIFSLSAMHRNRPNIASTGSARLRNFGTAKGASLLIRGMCLQTKTDSAVSEHVSNVHRIRIRTSEVRASVLSSARTLIGGGGGEYGVAGECVCHVAHDRHAALVGCSVLQHASVVAVLVL